MADGVRLMQAATTGNITEGGRKLMARSDLRQGISEFRMRAQQHYNRTDTGSVKMPELDFDMSGFDTDRKSVV